MLLKSNTGKNTYGAGKDEETPAAYSAVHVKLRFGAEAYDAFKETQDFTSPVAQAVTAAWNSKIKNSPFMMHYEKLDVTPPGVKVRRKDKNERKNALKEYLNSINIMPQGM